MRSDLKIRTWLMAVMLHAGDVLRQGTVKKVHHGTPCVGRVTVEFREGGSVTWSATQRIAVLALDGEEVPSGQGPSD